MSEQTTTDQKGFDWRSYASFGCALLVIIAVGLAGFLVGRASVETAAEPETLVEIQEVEVTREVPITTEPSVSDATVEVESTEDPADSPDVQPEPPTLVPTEVPTATPVAAPLADVDAIDFAVFNEVWNLIVNEFDGQVPSEPDILYSAIEGSLDSLDDEYTRFVEPDIAARLREDASGSVSGIGAFVRENEDGFVEIVAPIEGQPADVAGLLPGDLIVAVDGESVIDMSFDEVILMVRGPAGTLVSLTVVREGSEEELSFSIVRARFEVPIVDSELLGEPDSPIAYIRLTEFNQNAQEKLVEALGDLLSQEPVGVILDLRNNPGGFLDQSILIADVFLPESVVLYERNIRGLDQAFEARDGDIAEDIPLVVLVNEASASASEIVAGAVQAHGRGVLIGETTFGKGSVQSLRRLSDGSELRITIAHWFTPDNRGIGDAGVTPDIRVEMPATAEFGGEDDTQLARAIEYLQTGN